MALSPGGVFGGYLIERKLGAGGMGTVYAARHPRLPRRVALKVLGEHLGSSPEFRTRFAREAELAARVDHPNVVSVYDRGVEGDRLWIAMQYVDGVDVHELIGRGRSVLTPGRATFILAEAAKGLDSAHRRGLLHRDVKPANILVAEDRDEGDQVLVTDFGIARALDQTSALTNASSIAATVPFASPEQLTGRELDHRSDVYSLGCTLYAMLTGSLPYPRDSPVAVMHAHLADPPPRVTLENPELPVALDDVIARAMAKEPEHRYRSCRELASAAQAALTGSVPEHRPAAISSISSKNQSAADTSSLGAATGTVQRPMIKRALIIGVAVLAILIGLAGAAWLLVSGSQPQHGRVAATPGETPAEYGAPPKRPWRAYDYVANALPGLVPRTPSGVSYQGGTCQAINARLEPVDRLEADVSIARIMCRPAGGPSPGYIANYIVICNGDRTPLTLAGVADGLTAPRNQQWSRGSTSGQLIYGTRYGAGALVLSFDDPTRNFCSVVTNGNDGTSGQDVYDHWFRDAPL